MELADVGVVPQGPEKTDGAILGTDERHGILNYHPSVQGSKSTNIVKPPRAVEPDTMSPEAETWRNNMGKATVIQISVTIAVIALSSSTAAQMTPPKRACPIGNEMVMVQVQEVPDLKQRCYEVVYEKKKGYVCVWAGGTPERPYGFTENFNPEHVNKEGWTGAGGGNLGCKAEQCFRSLCSRLVRKHREEEGRTKFDPGLAAERLDEFFKPRVSGQTAEEPQ